MDRITITLGDAEYDRIDAQEIRESAERTLGCDVRLGYADQVESYREVTVSSDATDEEYVAACEWLEDYLG